MFTESVGIGHDLIVERELIATGVCRVLMFAEYSW